MRRRGSGDGEEAAWNGGDVWESAWRAAKGWGVPAGAAFFPEKCGTEGSGFRRKGVIFAGGL